MKPMLKPSGTKNLRLKCDELLSIFAFKLNLRRYDMETKAAEVLQRVGRDQWAWFSIYLVAGAYSRSLLSST
jgi:hypothetical protein